LATNPSTQPQNRVPAPAPAPAPTTPVVAQNPPQPQIPYKEGSAKYRVAKALISGEVDRTKLMRECGVKLNTVYNTVTELTGMGYALAIRQQRPRATATPITTSSTSPNPTTQQATPVSPSGGQPELATHQATPQGFTQGVVQQPLSEQPSNPSVSPARPLTTPVSGNPAPVSGQNNSLGGSTQLPPDLVNQIASK
jgi:hypothetical protein